MSAMLKQKLIDIANGFTKYGLWKGGGSKLSEMTDVKFTNLQANDVLTYNGSEWVNDDNLQTQIDTLNSNFVGLEKHYFLKENISFNNQAVYSFGNISILTNGKVTLNNLKCVSICASKVTLTAPVVNPEGILNIFSSDGNITTNTTVWIDIIYEE